MEPKQVIVVRHDLSMRKGKVAAQVAHASMKVILDLMDRQIISKTFDQSRMVLHKDDPLSIWMRGSFAKVVVRVNSLEELLEVRDNASKAGVRHALIVDAGRTEFHGVPTPTCVAVGPDYPDKVDPITGHLQLL